MTSYAVPVDDQSSFVVTGGASGIGRAVVEELLASIPGAVVTAVDVSPDGLADLVRAHPTVRTVVCDVTDRTMLTRAIEDAAAVAELAGLVNAAGISSVKDSIELTGEDLHSVLAVHLDASLFGAQAAARAMIAHGKGGAIVNFSSVAEDFAWPRRLPYAVAKAAIGAMTRTLAVEWAEHGIRVNAVAPGYVNTPLILGLVGRQAFDVEQRLGMHALGRFAEPREIATVVRFLLTADSSFMTGETVKADGGFSIKR